MQQQKKQLQSTDVHIVAYQPKYQQAFKELNEEWISKWFVIEDADRKVLDHPKEEILDKGGHIIIALHKEAPVGVCALLKTDDPLYNFELVKMAVNREMRGKNIGWLLGNAAIEKAKSLNATAIYLESNTVLAPAINLYRKMGFTEIAGHPTPYQRCNIQMELRLK